MEEGEAPPPVPIKLEPLEVSSASVSLLANNPLACNMCGKIFNNRRELLVHQWTHKERSNFYCANCDKVYNNENQFKRHMHVHTKEGKKFVTCDICKKIFRNNRVMEEHHIRDHAGVKPYRCGTCGIQFSWRENLRKHLQTHIDKPFACTICHESFRENNALETHSKIHKREMKELEKREKERIELEEREKRRELHKQMGVFSINLEQEYMKPKVEEIDDDDKTFKCIVCLQCFKYQFTLEAHMKGHVDEGLTIKKEGEEMVVVTPEVSESTLSKTTTSNPVFDKPHICQICQQAFRWEFCLDAHLKIHKQGFDAKVKKESERKTTRKGKTERRTTFHGLPTDENGKDKPEGTVVIVVEQIKEEEKQKRAQAAANRKRRAATRKTASPEPEPIIEPEPTPQIAPKRRQTRREAMAEQLPDEDIHEPEDNEPEEEKIDQEITFEFSDIMDTESPQPETKIVPQNLEMGEPEPKMPKLSPEVIQIAPIVELPVPLATTNQQTTVKTTRGKAKTRGGACVNSTSRPIDLNEVVASIGKETRQILGQRRGVNTRGGRSGPMTGDRKDYEEQGWVQEVDSEAEENMKDVEEAANESGDERGSANLEENESVAEEEGEEEQMEERDQEEGGGSEGEGSDAGQVEESGNEEQIESGNEDEHGEESGNDEQIESENEEEHGEESGNEEQIESGNEEEHGEESGNEEQIESGNEEEHGEESGNEEQVESGNEEESGTEEEQVESENEEAQGEESENEGQVDTENEDEQGDASENEEQVGSGNEHGEDSGPEDAVSEQGEASGSEGEENHEKGEKEVNEEQEGESEEEEASEQEEGSSDVEVGVEESGDEGEKEEGSDEEVDVGEEGEKASNEGENKQQGEENEGEDEEIEGNQSEEGDDAEGEKEDSREKEKESEKGSDDSDGEAPEELDEQELMKLKMKVYSCELCSKAFMESDLLMEHKVNYHQQNGDSGRNIFSALNKSLPSSRRISTSSRSNNR